MKKVLTLFLSVFVSLFVFAQSNDESNKRAEKTKPNRKPSIGISTQVVRPLEDFAATYSGKPIGLSANLSIPLKKNSPFELGGNFAWNNMGTFDQDIEVVALVTGDTISNPGTYRARNNNYRYLAQFRFRPFNGVIQPYFDLLGGYENFQTKTDITVQNSGGFSSVEDAKIVQQGNSLIFCLGGGLRFKLGKLNNLFIDLGYQLINGGKAEYVIPESVHLNQDNTIEFNIGKTSTKRDLIQFGVTLRF
jgi:hypothetical protein